MAFEEYEVSNTEGQPVYLYTFTLGNTIWRLTSADQDIPVGVDTYTAAAISDDGMTEGGSDQNDLQITMPSSHAVAQLFRNQKPSGKVFLTVRSLQYVDEDEETPVHWVGTVTNSVLADRVSAVLYCRSISGTYDRNGLRLPWGRGCPHALYGVGCFVDKDAHAYEHEIDTKTGTNFTVVTYADPDEGSFSGGFMEWERDDSSLERRGIESHDGNDFRIFGSTVGLEVGQAVTLYPGCARDTPNCILFDNLPNYGGFPHMPGRSPFDGAPVF